MRRHLFSLLLTLLLLASSSTPVHSGQSGGSFAPGASLRFEHLTIDDGLTQNAGLAMLQDSAGYLWIGSQDGLNRYDGYNIAQFKHDPDNPASLGFNSIASLYEDADGILWVGTWGGGLDRFDPQASAFTHYTIDPDDPDALINPVITSIIEDGRGGLWIGTLGGLEHFIPATGKFTHINSDPISFIQPADDGTLWVGTGAFGITGTGLHRFDIATGKSELMQPKEECFQSPNVSDIITDPQGNLWISYGGYGVTGGGIDRFNPKSGKCSHFDSGQTSDNQITDNNLTDLMIDRDGAVWATSWSGGVWQFPSIMSRGFNVVHHDDSDPESLSNDNTFSILQDRSGVIWIGTLSAGINKLNLDTLQFRTYRHKAADPESLASNHIGSFAETSDGMMWVGTWENGLQRFNPSTGKCKNYRNDLEDPQSLSSDLVMSLLADEDGSLWVGTLGGGLNHFDPRTEKFTRYQNDPNDPASLLENQVTYLLRDPDGRLWAGTFLGLSRLDPGADRFVNYPMNAPPVALKVIEDELWIGTWGGGVLRLELTDPNLDPAQATFSTLLHDPADPNSLSENSVWGIEQTSDGMVWLGTQGGLNRYDPKTGDFKVYTEKNGLRNSTILTVNLDKQGFLWLTTNNGLAKFDPRTETFRIYDKSDGLQGNEFNSNAAFFSHNTGDLYVGGVSGFSIFDPTELKDNTVPPNVVITDFSIFNAPQSFDSNEPIRLSYDQNFISFEFAALDFQAPYKNQYAYKLEGFDRDWVQAGTRNYASYTNLPGGNYTFRVKAANSDGMWNEEGASLKLTVIPPFWQTLPFRIGIAVGLILLVAAGFNWRVRAVREQNVRLQKMVDDQKRVEAELRESEARFRAMFENAAVGISIISPEGKTLAVNPVLVKLSGRSEAELIEIGGRGVTYPEDQEVGMAEFHEIQAGKRDSYQVEKRYVHEDGKIHWMRQSVSAVRDEAGKVRYMIVIAEDIEERKRALEELQQSEAKFRAMFESSAIGMGLGEINGNILAANAAICKMSGYTEEELKQRSDAENCYPEDAQVGMDLFAEMMAGKRDYYSVEKRYVRKNGEVFWTRLTLSLVRDSEGKPSYLVNMVEDIDDQKKKSEELRESEARFRSMFDNAAVGVAVMTLDRHITQINQTAERMTGYSQEEIREIDPTTLVMEEDRFFDRHLFIELVEGRRDQYTVEKRYLRENGDIFWGRVNFSSVHGADGKPLYIIGMIEDITEEKRVAEKLAAQEAEHRRQLEQRIAERTEELNLANERLREKAAQDAVIAERTRLARDLHDAVTQTLFSTTLIADVLPDIWEMNPDEGKRRLDEIRLLTRGALAEMRTLLVELRPNALVEVPLPTLLRQLTEALSGRARINIQLSAEGERKLPADVQISLYRIAQEALNNVFKHSKASEAVVTLRMGDSVRLTVADNGSGFDPSTVTADHLGVKIMRERADAIGAKLSIYSEPGEGTQISVVWQSSVGAG
jgi:PAS domain S-box-containing protein